MDSAGSRRFPCVNVVTPTYRQNYRDSGQRLQFPSSTCAPRPWTPRKSDDEDGAETKFLSGKQILDAAAVNWISASSSSSSSTSSSLHRNRYSTPTLKNDSDSSRLRPSSSLSDARPRLLRRGPEKKIDSPFDWTTEAADSIVDSLVIESDDARHLINYGSPRTLGTSRGEDAVKIRHRAASRSKRNERPRRHRSMPAQDGSRNDSPSATGRSSSPRIRSPHSASSSDEKRKHTELRQKLLHWQQEVLIAENYSRELSMKKASDKSDSGVVKYNDQTIDDASSKQPKDNQPVKEYRFITKSGRVKTSRQPRRLATDPRTGRTVIEIVDEPSGDSPRMSRPSIERFDGASMRPRRATDFEAEIETLETMMPTLSTKYDAESEKLFGFRGGVNPVQESFYL